jgi:hypothetical protein
VSHYDHVTLWLLCHIVVVSHNEFYLLWRKWQEKRRILFTEIYMRKISPFLFSTLHLKWAWKINNAKGSDKARRRNEHKKCVILNNRKNIVNGKKNLSSHFFHKEWIFNQRKNIKKIAIGNCLFSVDIQIKQISSFSTSTTLFVFVGWNECFHIRHLNHSLFKYHIRREEKKCCNLDFTRIKNTTQHSNTKFNVEKSRE